MGSDIVSQTPICRYQSILAYETHMCGFLSKEDFIRKCQNIYWDPMWWP